MAKQIPLGSFAQVATSETMAAAVREPGSEAQQSVDERVFPVAADIIQNDPDVIQAAAERALTTEGVVMGAATVPDAPGTAWAHTTESGIRLPLGYGSDGHLDAFAKRIFKEDVARLVEVTTDPRYAVLWLSETGHVVLAVHRDGTVTIPGFEGAARALSRSSDRYVREGDVLPVYPDMSKVSGWGSSSMQGIASRFNALFGSYGATYVNGGLSGAWAEHIAARLGSRPALLTVTGGTIPASGAVAVTTSSMIDWAGWTALEGTLAGVAGALTYSSGWQFTRTSPGDPVTIESGTPFIPTVGNECRDGVVLLWMGKNNFSPTVPGRDESVIELTDASFDWLAPLHKRALVLGHFADRDEPAVSMERDQIIATNAAHQERYGDLFVDIYGFMSDPLIWEYSGVTPTGADLDTPAGNIPPSLASDNQHLNTAGYIAVTKYIQDRIDALNYF